MYSKILLFFGLFAFFIVKSQSYSGKIFLEDAAELYISKVYVTNLSSHNSVLSGYDGSFSIAANSGDIIRFSSVNTEREDVKVSPEMLKSGKNLIHLKMAVYSIQEVILKKFKPSGDIRRDMKYFKDSEKNLELAKIIGLPSPTVKDETALPPVASFAGGGLSFDIASIYDIISGEREKKIRAYNYEKMSKTIAAIRKYYGDDYFTALKIPRNHIDNFLQFIYSSDDLELALGNHNLEAAKYFIEKYLPVYLKRISTADYHG